MTTPKTRTHAKTAETLGGEQALAEALCVNVYARAGWLQDTSDAPDAAYSWPLKSSLTVPLDGVRLEREHLDSLARTEKLYFRESRAPVPYLPLLMMPYYVYVGRVPAAGL